MRGGGSLKAPKSSVFGYTLAEIIIVMLIIAVVVSVTIGITKAKLNNIVSYTYYNAYSTLQKISTEMLADFDFKDDDYVSVIPNFIPAAYADRITDRPSSGDRPSYGCSNYRRCAPGYHMDYQTCTCVKDKVTCWDGSTADSSSACPPKITCWDGSVASNASSCPKADCWDGSQAANPSSCPPKISCWDGTNVTNEVNCPSYVTCWNGNKAHNWSECPSCTNKPSVTPCGQVWDEHTCQLTGTAKTCPSGQHLNSSCNCVTDCPADLSPCNICSDETGIVSQNPAINRTCSDDTYEWSEEQCKCIPSPRTLPRKGKNFCKLFERYANIMSGSDVCNGSVISDGTTDFSGKTPDITLRNGLRIYNMHNDAGAISMLSNNTQGGVYDGVPNTNSYGYTVYVDIDGSKGDSQLWSDVYPFYITLSGKIIPAYDTSNANSSGGDSVRHLQVSVENENYNSGKRSTKWLAKSVPFKEGACIAGYVGDATPYCKNGTSFTKASECTTNYNSLCRVNQIQPVKFFF